MGLVVPWWSSFRTAFVDAGAGCLLRSRAESPVPNWRAGCPRWIQVKELLQTRGPVALQWSRVPGAFVDTGAGCPAVVSGSRRTSWREGWLSSTARAPETRVRGLTTHCRRDPQNPKGDKTKGLGLLSAWAPGRSEQSGRCGGSRLLPLRAGRH